jgi:hypothetical protein
LKRFPYHDGIEAGGYLISRMSDAEFLQMMPALLERYRKLVGDRS